MSQPVDPDFAARVATYKRNAKKGIAFAAPGTVSGKRARGQGPAWRARPLLMLMRMIVLVIGVKALLFHVAAMSGYNAYSGMTLSSASPFERLGGLMFYPDPISTEISRFLTIGQFFFANEVRTLLKS